MLTREKISLFKKMAEVPMKLVISVLFISAFFYEGFAQSTQILLNNWTYLQIDNSRAKWGDWDPPGWVRYFGLDMQDITGNGYKDIVSGRYFYRNPG